MAAKSAARSETGASHVVRPGRPMYCHSFREPPLVGGDDRAVRHRTVDHGIQAGRFRRPAFYFPRLQTEHSNIARSARRSRSAKAPTFASTVFGQFSVEQETTTLCCKPLDGGSVGFGPLIRRDGRSFAIVQEYHPS